MLGNYTKRLHVLIKFRWMSNDAYYKEEVVTNE